MTLADTQRVDSTFLKNYVARYGENEISRDLREIYFYDKQVVLNQIEDSKKRIAKWEKEKAEEEKAEREAQARYNAAVKSVGKQNIARLENADIPLGMTIKQLIDASTIINVPRYSVYMDTKSTTYACYRVKATYAGIGSMYCWVYTKGGKIYRVTRWYNDPSNRPGIRW